MKKKLKVALLLACTMLFAGGLFTQQAKAEDADLRVLITDSNGIEYEPEGFDYPHAEHTDQSGDGWSYSSETNTMTLEGYQGGGIYVDTMGSGSEFDFTIILKGDNYITGNTDNAGYALLNIGRHSQAVRFTMKGEGKLTVNQTGKYQTSLSADDFYIEDTVTLICTANDSNALAASCVHLAKGATVKVKALSFPFIAASTNDKLGKNEIYGTLIAETTGDLKSRQPYYYTSYSTILGSDRVIYAGESEKKAKLVKLETVYGVECMPYLVYDFVAVLSKDAVPANADTSSDQAKVKKVTLSSVKSSKAGCANLNWKKVSGVDGYEIYYSTAKSGTYKKLKTITKAKTVTYTKTKLKDGNTYYFKLRAYKTVDGKKVYGNYSTVKGVKIVK